MLHRDLTFASLTTLKHAVMVYRSRSTRTLYVSTPFFPGATTPTFTQALLSQIICAYQEALERDVYGGSANDDSEPPRAPRDRRRGRGPRGGSRGGAPPRGTKRKGKEPEPGPSKRLHGESPSDYDKIPVATLSTMKQLELAKVSLSIVWFLITSGELHFTVDADRGCISVCS
jgi:hypothetical protein